MTMKEKFLTLLETFLFLAQDPRSAQDLVIEYGAEQWTYGDLDLISTGLAREIQALHGDGSKPVVVSISENRPYVLAMLLATWKLGGIFAPLDCHAPPDMVKKMVETIAPTCASLHEHNKISIEVMGAMKIPVIAYHESNTTLDRLLQRFLDQSSRMTFEPTIHTSVALYTHTSSASGPSNLKCVALTHEIIFRGSKARVDWWKRTWPLQLFNKVKVLGWAPWSHMMAFAHDIGAAAFITGGCYVFGLVDSGQDSEKTNLDQLLDSIIRVQPDVFSAVPWVVEGFMERSLKIGDKALVHSALKRIKVFSCGGASLSTDAALWAHELGLNMVNDIGMTEIGAPLFHAKLNLSSHGDPTCIWSKPDIILDDVQLKLVDDGGKEVFDQGELVVSSPAITSAYFKYDSSAFSIASDGLVTFKTGDIYERKEDGHFVWMGRRHDYIQMASSETFDPRPIEAALDACPAIARSCVVGNNFMRKASDSIFAIIQPALSNGEALPSSSDKVKITRAVATINKTLPPPLRISWSRVIILDRELQIPRTRKGAIFRKKLEQVFGKFLERGLEVEHGGPDLAKLKSRLEKDQIVEETANVISEVLQITPNFLKENATCTFAEFGMDSNMAVRIVKNLNHIFSMSLPANACHIYIDFAMLSRAVLTELRIDGLPSAIQSPHSLNHRHGPEIEDIVIVGQAFRLPGDINTPESFWKALVTKREDIMTHIPEDRWDHQSFYRPPGSTDHSQPGDITFNKAGFIDVAHFDNNFFGISTAEAFFTGPIVRLTLETAFQALEDACIPISGVKGTNMGVYVAPGVGDGYHQMIYHEQGFQSYSRFFGTGIASSSACGRLSYLLDIHGPSLTVDTACSSGLVALDHAVQFLQSGAGESAIVVAVNTSTWPGSFGFISAQNMSSVHSRCATFTTEADGYVPSEGAVAFIVKTKSAAVRDNDNILAVIKASEVRHGGRSQGLAAPNVTAQIELHRSLIAKAGLSPSDVDFLETHGTGTKLGDMIEIQGINTVFQDSHPDTPLILGAGKTCLGHTEAAAGLVGLLKAIASLKHSAVPGLTHLTEENLNPSLDCKSVPLHIPMETVSLPPRQSGVPHYGLVVSNGFTGTIAGTIICSPTGLIAGAHYDPAENNNGPHLFVVSAKTMSGLKQYLYEYLTFCRNAAPDQLPSICYTTCVGREHYRYRFATVVASMEELVRNLEKRIETSFSLSQRPVKGIAFAFPGQGSHYQGMAASLASSYPAFKEILSSASSAASKLTGSPILSFLLDSSTEADAKINDTQASQVSIFVYQYSVGMWLQTLGIVPAGVLGHSLGEITASVMAGAFSFDTGLEFVATRASVLRSDPGEASGMAIIAASSTLIEELISELGLIRRLTIAVYNAPQSHVVSGESSAIDIFLEKVKSNGIRGAKLNVTQGFHSSSIHPSLPKLETWLHKNERFMNPLSLPLYSTTTASQIPVGELLTPLHWIRHARDPVRFYDAIQTVDSSKSIDLILDVGPQPFIWTVLQDVTQRKATIATTTKRNGDQITAFLKSIAALFEYGVAVELFKLFHVSSPFKKVSIPTYPFQRQRYYPTSAPSRNKLKIAKANAETSRRKIRFPVDEPLYNLLSHHQIEGRRVSPGAALADFFARASPSKSVESVTFNAPLVLVSPSAVVVSEIDIDGQFTMFNSESTKVCTGVLASEAPAIPRITAEDGPFDKVDHTAVYESFSGVHFGASFRNIQEIKMYATHADALISLRPSQYPTLDRIRKLDPCLHMFGAIVPRKVPEILDMNGLFLPNSLEDFTLYTDDIPDTFICRYQLPVTITRNKQVISTAWEVLSLDGEVILSCRKYTVAWIPAGVVVQKQHETTSDKCFSEHWLQPSWISHPSLLGLGSTISDLKTETMLCISSEEHASRVSAAFSAFSKETHFLSLPTTGEVGQSWWGGISKHTDAGEITIVLDLSTCDVAPTSPHFTSITHHVLVLLQALGSCKATISNFVVVSQRSIPIDANSQNGASWEASALAVPGASALVQGMIRVFRREAALDEVIWALDLPALNSVGDADLRKLISEEMIMRLRGLSKHRTVGYRRGADGGLSRMVSVLRPIPTGAVKKVEGVTLIVGLGDIGSALGPALVSNGSSKVIFIGRRSRYHPEVIKTLKRLQGQTGGLCQYMPADVCDMESLRKAIVAIQWRFGNIMHIVHTAAVIEDATVHNVTFSLFDRVLKAKVMGSWNLHLLTEQFCPQLKSFVCLSSVNVSLGNKGQIAYVAGNFFMETLAGYRRARNLPAVCLQLGAWESRAVQNLDTESGLARVMLNEDGIPLILKAMSMPVPVQLIVEFNVKKMAAIPAYAGDPLFGEVLPLAEAEELRKEKMSLRKTEEVGKQVISILRDILELRADDTLETGESLTSCGIDSISFAQIRGKVMADLEIELPMIFLSETHTIQDMIQHVEKKYKSVLGL